MNFRDNFVLIKVEGKNVRNFILKLHNKKISLYDVNIINRNTSVLKINYLDYERVKDKEILYKITKIKEYGYNSTKNKLKKNKILVMGFILSFILIIILSNLIFKIEIIHTNKEIKKTILNELKNNGIKKYSFKKSYNQLEKIEKLILNNNKDKLEWLEIIESGTAYKVKLEMRKIIKSEIDNIPSNVVAKKNAVIKKIIATNGLVIKNINDYVEKGEVIISGDILKGMEVVNSVKAVGQVFGEVWYTATVELPFLYQEEILEKEYQLNFGIKFLNNYFYLFRKKHEFYEVTPFWVVENKQSPFSFGFFKLQKISKRDEIYSYNEALNKAIEIAKKKLLSRLGKDDKILTEKTLKNHQKDSKIVVDIFFNVYEDITDVKEIIREEKKGE